MGEVTRDQAISFLESACRNWKRLPPLDNDDIEDVRLALHRFRTPAKAGEEGVERVARALCELRIRQVRKHDTAQDQLEEMLPAAVDYAWRYHEEEARVAISALHGDQEG